jgi:hypothetical protein
MKVESINNNRFRAAIEFLKENQALNFNDVHFSLNKEKYLVEVGCESTWTGRITPETALSDIQRGIDTFEYLLEQSADFAETVKGYSPRFSLIVDEGMVTVEVAFLSKGEIIFV